MAVFPKFLKKRTPSQGVERVNFFLYCSQQEFLVYIFTYCKFNSSDFLKTFTATPKGALKPAAQFVFKYKPYKAPFE